MGQQLGQPRVSPNRYGNVQSRLDQGTTASNNKVREVVPREASKDRQRPYDRNNASPAQQQAVVDRLHKQFAQEPKMPPRVR